VLVVINAGVCDNDFKCHTTHLIVGSITTILSFYD
jgi:hypothetical protein